MSSKFILGTSMASDASFFVSGSIGGKGLKGTAVFGGDLYVSGNIFHENNTAGLPSNTGYGEIIKLGSTATTAGKLYYYKSTGWAEVDAADSVTPDGANQLLGLALENNSSKGMLLKGFANVTVTGQGANDEGKPVYIDKTGAGGTGKFTVTAPSSPGDFVRLVGWIVADNGIIYFSPSNDWLEL